MIFHQPVLLNEVVKLLNPRKGDIFLTPLLVMAATQFSLLRHEATVFGLDADKNNLTFATQRIAKLNLSATFHPLWGNFFPSKNIWKKHINTPLTGSSSIWVLVLLNKIPKPGLFF